jgi:hypothetical protein
MPFDPALKNLIQWYWSYFIMHNTRKKSKIFFINVTTINGLPWNEKKIPQKLFNWMVLRGEKGGKHCGLSTMFFPYF